MYKRLGAIHNGPFCDVYRGETQSGEVVALKVADIDFLRKPHDLKTEIQIMKSLHHPNIVSLLDTYNIFDDYYIVMPYYERNLIEVMQLYTKRKMRFNLDNPEETRMQFSYRIPLSYADAIVWGLVDAIEYLHLHLVIHRDIKPSNVFFKDNDSFHTPILGDFGISYDCQKPPPDEPLERKVTDIATGYYKAPELCFSVCDYGREVDYWSLGILISYLFSQDGEPANKVIDENRTEEFPELNDFVLLQGTFEAFGTPTVTDQTSELYWPKLANPEFNFVNFRYVPHERKPVNVLLPRCENDDIKRLFSGLTQYDNRQILRPAALK